MTFLLLTVWMLAGLLVARCSGLNRLEENDRD